MEDEGLMGELRLPSEKREYPRVPMSVAVRYKVLDSEEAKLALGRSFDPDSSLKEFKEGETLDVSRSGALIYLNEEIAAKTMMIVNMYISVPGISCNCKALAEVIRRDKAGEGEKYEYKAALKFLKILHHNLKSYKFLNLNDLLDVRGQDQ